ncbi:MAG: hypothetical protein JST26_16675 [Bacteroidetes bacterium]|nr:hypothetical protein [Bacteroidota bacterium]
MRKIHFIRLLLLLVIPLMAFKKEKCNSDILYEETLKKMKKFSLIKDYRIYLKKKKKKDQPEFQYFNITLNRGVKYKFFSVSSSEFTGKMIMNLYSNPQKEFMVATTLSQASGDPKESVEFLSQTTGNFCVGFYFKDGEEGCGVGILSFQQ